MGGGEVIKLFRPGDKVKVKMRSYTKQSMTTYTGLIEFVHERFITIHTGKYRVTVLTADLRSGDASIELIKRGGILDSFAEQLGRAALANNP